VQKKSEDGDQIKEKGVKFVSDSSSDDED